MNRPEIKSFRKCALTEATALSSEPRVQYGSAVHGVEAVVAQGRGSKTSYSFSISELAPPPRYLSQKQQQEQVRIEQRLQELSQPVQRAARNPLSIVDPPLQELLIGSGLHHRHIRGMSRSSIGHNYIGHNYIVHIRGMSLIQDITIQAITI